MMQLSKEEQILILMKRKGINKSKLAQMIGVSKQNINYMMKDIKTFESLDKIVTAIGATYHVEVKEII